MFSSGLRWPVNLHFTCRPQGMNLNTNKSEWELWVAFLHTERRTFSFAGWRTMVYCDVQSIAQGFTKPKQPHWKKSARFCVNPRLYGVLLRDNGCFMCLLCFSRLVLSWEVRPRKAIWKRMKGTQKTPHQGSITLSSQCIIGPWQTFSTPQKTRSPSLLTKDHDKGKDSAALN